jgi:hypothetical protein
MKGIETSTLIGLIIVVLVILVVFVGILVPATAFGETAKNSKNFEEFCVFWGLDNYAQTLGESVDMNGESKSVTAMCSDELRRTASTTADYNTCVKCCKKEIVC